MRRTHNALRLSAALLAILFFFPLQLSAQTVRIGVLGIFHPRELVLSAADSEAVVVSISDQSFVLDPATPRDIARITIEKNSLLVEIKGQSLPAKTLHAASRSGGPVTFVLSVPEKITRQYRGQLSLDATNNPVIPVVTMDLETAVASAVLGESAPGASLEALKAQAVVARSYYSAGSRRHKNYDFCDLTHCQVLRHPPALQSAAARATASTAGLVITYQNKTIATMFTRSCAGHTHTPAELGLSTNSYPYFAVLCEICRRLPIRWTRSVSPEDAALLAQGEAGRLIVARRLGWTAIPSNNFTIATESPATGSAAANTSAEVILQGAGQGHGIGLCQRGAQSLAQSGATFRQILSHYFPNTTLALRTQRSP